MSKAAQMKKPLKLNLGCGDNKLEGYVNIDTEKSVKPDLVHNFVEHSLPYKAKSVDEIVFFHTIEHIRKDYHLHIFVELFRVLKVGAPLYISYPNFWECATRWKDNYLGKRDYWHKTMFGRQLYPSDYHVCAMDPRELEILLRGIGYENVSSWPEKFEHFNSITTAFRGKLAKTVDYEALLAEDMSRIQRPKK